MPWARGRQLPDVVIALGFALFLLVVYQLNGGIPVAEDYVNLRVAEAICDQGSLTVTPVEMPTLFRWQLVQGGQKRPVDISWFDAELTAAKERGELVMAGSRDVLLPTEHEGRYGNCFGLGPALAVLPTLAVVHGIMGPLAERHDVLFGIGKFTAAAYVAASAAILYLTSRRYCQVMASLMIAVLYGLGTCAWSVSSQSLWQHAPNQFFLALVCYGLSRIRDHGRYAVLTGAALGAAVWCRPTSALFVLSTVAYLLGTNRPALARLLAGGLPFAVGMIVYNQYLYGDWIVLGQARVVVAAVERTGSTNMWQTPLWLGAWGKLMSPSRGLFVFSPFLLFAPYGAWQVWRDAKYAPLRPLTLGIAAIWCVEFHFFDWWGGWSFGYRHLVDTVVLLVLLLIPFIPVLSRRRSLAVVFAGLACFSIGVQALGAWTYDGVGWNGREAFVVSTPGAVEQTLLADPSLTEDWPPAPGTEIDVVNLDIDFGANRRRLWSWRDSQLVYYAMHVRQSYQKRLDLTEYLTRSPAVRRAETYVQLGNAYFELNQINRAQRMYELALALVPGDRDAVLGAARCSAAGGRIYEAVDQLRQAVVREPQELRSLSSLALALQLASRSQEAVATATAARGIHPIYARKAFRDEIARWRQLVEPRLDRQQRAALSQLEGELNADWFYRSL